MANPIVLNQMQAEIIGALIRRGLDSTTCLTREEENKAANVADYFTAVRCIAVVTIKPKGEE